MMTTDGPLDGLMRAIERAEEQDRLWFEQRKRQADPIWRALGE